MTSTTVAAMLAVALLANFGVSGITRMCSKRRVRGVTKRNVLSFSPRLVGGRGPPGGSPLFGLFWTTIYALVFGSVFVFAFVECTPDLETSGILMAVALLLAACWQPIFIIELPWSFATSAVILFVVMVVAIASAAIADPFRSIDNVWYLYIFGLGATILAGWASVATVIAIGLTIRVYSRGINARITKGERSLLPLLLAIVLCVLAIALANPLLCGPLIIASCFMPGILSDWRVYSTFLVACLGYGLALMRLWVG